MQTQQISRAVLALCNLVAAVPQGTNLALVHVLWALLSGQLLPSRGALIPALLAIGLSTAAVRRAWAALSYGAWHTSDLVAAWETQVRQEGRWQPTQYGGYQPQAVDLSGFWRPALRDCATKHYHPGAGKALPAIPLGLLARIGVVEGQRVAVLRALVRPRKGETAERLLRRHLLEVARDNLAPNEIAVCDAGFPLREIQEVGVSRFVRRAAQNATFRRNALPPAKGKGRHAQYGVRVRPLPRTRKGQTIPATPPDRVVTWTEAAVTFRAECWDNLVRPDQPVAPQNATFTVVAVYDPRYPHPWLLVCYPPLPAPVTHALYRDRWPVEHPPLCAKQLLGAHRQFVFGRESRYRLPELSLLVGTVLTYLAATGPALSTGFWDRQPRRTPGRLRRLFAGQPFPQSLALPEHFREKAAVTAHLPKGILGHRRQKARIPRAQT